MLQGGYKFHFSCDQICQKIKSILIESHFGNPEKEMSNWIKFQKASPFCSILSTQNRETDKEIERKNEIKNIQDQNSPLKNRAYCQLNTDIDESQDLLLTSSDVGHLNIESFSRSKSTTTLAGSTFVSADTETCYNRVEKTTTIINVEKPYIHETFAKVSEQFGIERDSSFGASNLSEITLPSAGHYGMSNDKGEHSLSRYQTHISNLSGLPISKSLINPNNKVQKEKEQEPGFASKLGEQLSLTFERFEIQEVKKVESQPVWHRDSLKLGCTSRNCVYSQKCDNPLLTHSKKKFNSRDINQMHLTLSSKQSSCDSLKACCKKGFRILDNSDGRETKKRKYEEGFEPDKKKNRIQRQRKFIDQKNQSSVDIDQSQEKSFTSNCERIINAMSFSMLKSTSSCIGGTVVSAEAETKYNIDNKNKIKIDEAKPFINESNEKVSDQLKV